MREWLAAAGGRRPHHRPRPPDGRRRGRDLVRQHGHRRSGHPRDRGAAGQERPAGRRGLRGRGGARPGRPAAAAGRPGRRRGRRARHGAAVARQPVVAIIPTGDEIRPPGSTARPGEILDTNSLMLAARCRQLGRGPGAERDAAGRPGRAGGRDPPPRPRRRPGAGHRRVEPGPRRPRGRRARPGRRRRRHRRGGPARPPGPARPRQAPGQRGAADGKRPGRDRAGHRPARLPAGQPP